MSPGDGPGGAGRNRNRKGGGGRGKGREHRTAASRRPDKGGGTGAALGSAVLRYSGIHGLGMVAANIITFASTIVIANFSKPAEFGQLGLLMFYSGLLTLVFTLASKQGTLKRTFGGGDDEEDDDDDEDEELSSDPRHSFGTGLITITVVSLIGTALSIVFADQIANGLLGGGADPNLIVYAALAGGAGALYRLASIAIWIERRPYAYIAVETAKPIFTLAAVVTLLVAGLGIKGAIAGHALGMVLGTLMSLFILRGSWSPTWDIHEAAAIYRKGAIRVPLVLSMWVVGYADIYLPRSSSTTRNSAPTTSPRRRPSSSRSSPVASASAAAAEDADVPSGREGVRRRDRPRHPVRLLLDHARRDDAGDCRDGHRDGPRGAAGLRRRCTADTAGRRRPRRPDRLPDDQQVGEVRRQARPVHHRRDLRDVPVHRARCC